MTKVFVAVIVALAIVDYCTGAHCADGKLETAEINDKILKVINDRRVRLVKGQQNNVNGLLPKGKNMRKMEWDCGLEKEAIAAADSTCPDPIANIPKDKALVYHADYDYTDTAIVDVLTSLMDYIDVHEIVDKSGDVKWTNETVLKNYAHLMRSTTSKIGCHMNKCTVDGDPKYALYCLTNDKPITAGEVIYQKDISAQTCVCDSTEFYCDENGFCISSTTTTSTTTTTTTSSTSTTSPPILVTFPQGTNTRCSMNSGMIDELRTELVNMHNYRRSLLAQGKIQRVNGNYYPKATNMARMTYNCQLEADALNYAKQCPSTKSGVTDAGENFFVVSTSGLSGWTPALKKAVTTWWKIVRTATGDNGIGISAVTFRQHHVNRDITSWSQMAWAKTNKLGCSIVICNNNYITVCRYREKGNIVGQQVYVPGKLCAACPNNCNSNGLCQ